MSAPRKRTVRKGDGPSPEDLAEFQAALDEMLPSVELPALPGDEISALAKEVAARGYYLGISASVGRAGYIIRIPVGKKAVEAIIGAGADPVDVLRRVLLVCKKLPPR